MKKISEKLGWKLSRAERLELETKKNELEKRRQIEGVVGGEGERELVSIPSLLIRMKSEVGRWSHFCGKNVKLFSSFSSFGFFFYLDLIPLNHPFPFLRSSFNEVEFGFRFYLIPSSPQSISWSRRAATHFHLFR